MREPVNSISMASDCPIARISRWVPPAPGMLPMQTSGKPNTALLDAIRMSHCKASSRPPPSAKPLMAAITGLPVCRLASPARVLAAPKCNSAKLSRGGIVFLRSAPVQKARSPAPVRMATRMLSSFEMRSQAACSSLTDSGSSAFIASGRSNKTVAMKSLTSMETGMSSPVERGKFPGGRRPEPAAHPSNPVRPAPRACARPASVGHDWALAQRLWVRGGIAAS